MVDTFVRYTTCLARFRADPTALARRVIANAWHSQWRRLGKFSWWVLGLFLGRKSQELVTRDYGPSGLAERARRQWDVAFGGVEGLQNLNTDLDSASKNTSSNLDHRSEHPRVVYPGLRHRQLKVLSPSPAEVVKESAFGCLENGHRSPVQSLQSNMSRSWSSSLALWGKFSFAILLAIGGAVIDGPAVMLKDCDTDRTESSRSIPKSTGYSTSTTPGSCTTKNSTESGRSHSDHSSDSQLRQGASWMDGCPPLLNSASAKSGTNDPAKRSRRKLESQRDMMAVDKALTLGTPSRDENELNADAGESMPKRARKISQVRSRSVSSDDKENLQPPEDDEDDSNSDFESGRSFEIEAKDINRTIRPRPIPKRQDIEEVTWFQNLGLQDFDRGRI